GAVCAADERRIFRAGSLAGLGEEDCLAVRRQIEEGRPVEPGELPFLGLAGAARENPYADRVMRDEDAPVRRNILERQALGDARKQPLRPLERNRVERAIASDLRAGDPDLGSVGG